MEIFFPTLQFTNNNPTFVIKNLPLNVNEGYYQELKSVLKIRRVENVPLVRIGQKRDGGYILAANFRKDGIAYSFGISSEISWDFVMSQLGYEIFMYDMTVDGPPLDSPQFHFVKEGIGGKKDVEKSLDTLESFIKRNSHENNSNMILKMDVEGSEWDFLENVSSDTLSQFDQMVFEFHGLTNPKTFDEMDRTINLIDKINATHALVHLHGNNSGHYVKLENIGVIPNVLELTYLRTENYSFYDDDEIFLPAIFDAPNNSNVPDIPLGYWNKFQWR